MADSRQRMLFEIFAKDRGAKREFDRFAKSVDDAGDSMDGMGKDARTLDKQIETTKKLIRQLGDEFDRTGNRDLFGDIKKGRADLAILQQIRKELDGDRPVARRSIFGQLFDSVGDTLKSLPSQLKGAAIVGGVGLGAVLAPAVGAALAGAVVGGVGLGGIAGGIAAAAQDNRVRSEASKLGHSLMAELQGLGSPFVAPLLAEFGELDEIGASFAADLRKGLTGLAPLIKPLVEGVRGFQRNIGPGLGKMFEAARPAIRALANELPEIGDALSDMFDTISKDDRATKGLIGMLHALESLVRVGGEWIGFLEYQYDWLVTNGDRLNDYQDRWDALALFMGPVSNKFADASDSITTDMDKARDATGDFNTTVVGLEGSMYDVANATDEAHTAMVGYAKGIEDQLDPISNFIHRQQDVAQAQRDYSQAVKDHGPKSQEAKDANLQLAEAILAANSAALNASGTFDGHFSEALKATLRAGGMTEKQIRDLETAAIKARAALEKYEGVYTAKAVLEFYSYRAGERDPSGSAAANRNKPPSKKRASGGPVMTGNTYWVGEQGPELVTFGHNGTVIPAQRSAAMASAAGGSPTVRVTLDAAGAADDLKSLFLKWLRVDAGFRATVTAYVAEA